MVDPATGLTGDLDLMRAGLSRIDRSTGTIYANTSQGPLPIGIDQPAATLAQIVERRNDDDPDTDSAHIKANGADDSPSGSEPLDSANPQTRLTQILAQLQSYGGVPQRLEARVAALQAGLSGSDPDDPKTQSARQGLASAQAALAQWKQDHPDYTALIREKSDLQASLLAQQAAQDQSDASIKGSLASPETVRMNGAIPPEPTPALGSGDVSLSAIQQRAGDLARQLQITPSAALRAALVEAKKGGATTVGGADITQAILNVRSTRPPGANAVAVRGVSPSISSARQWNLAAYAQDFWSRAKDFGATVEQGLSRPIAGVLGAVAAGDHLLTGTPVNDTDSKRFADSVNEYWSEALNSDYADSTLNEVTGAVAPIVPTLVAERFGGSAGGTIFNALSMGGEALLEAKEKGWSDSHAMEMFAVNMGFGAVGGRVISRSLNRIDTLTGGSLSKYILSLAKANASRLVPAVRVGLAIGQSALEGGLFSAVQVFGSEAWAKLRNLGDADQRGWSTIWNDAKTAGVQNALSMALTTLFAAGALPPTERQQLADQGQKEAPSSPPSSEPPPSPTPPALTRGEPARPPETPEPPTEKSGPIPATTDPHQESPSATESAPSADTVHPLAQRVADLHDEATTLRAKIAAAHEEDTPEAIGELGAHLDAEKDTQAQFHHATQDLIDSVPEDVRGRIERAAAGPGLDYEAIRARNREDPTYAFATAEIGNALRDEYLTDRAQRKIRKTADAKGADPALADRIADQSVGARVVSELDSTLRGPSIEPTKARILKQMGLLKPARMSDGTRRLAITDDVLPLLPKSTQEILAKNPKAFRVVHTKGPPADGLNRIVDGGRQRFAETAKGMNL